MDRLLLDDDSGPWAGGDSDDGSVEDTSGDQVPDAGDAVDGGGSDGAADRSGDVAAGDGQDGDVGSDAGADTYATAGRDGGVGSGQKWRYECPGGQFGARGTEHMEEAGPVRTIKYLADQDLAAHVSQWPNHAGVANVRRALEAE
jgi:hypothetical protein